MEKETKTVGSNDYVKDSTDIAKNIFQKPVSTVEKYAKNEKMSLGLILGGIGSVIIGIFVYLIVKELVKTLSAGYLGLMLGSSGSLSDNVGKIIFTVAIYLIAYYAVLASMLHVFAGVIFKAKDSDIKKNFALVGVSSVILTITVIISGICMYINGYIALIVYLLGSLVFNYVLYQAFSDSVKLDKNKVIYAFVGTLAVAMFVVFYILPKIFS